MNIISHILNLLSFVKVKLKTHFKPPLAFVLIHGSCPVLPGEPFHAPAGYVWLRIDRFRFGLD